ncbi:MAG TPA: penicillin-binding protein 2 [Actinomycetota bacterium]
MTATSAAISTRKRTAGAGGSRKKGSTARAGRRLVALFCVLVFGLSAILVRLVQLQVRDSRAYRTLAWDQRVRTIDLPASRGSIFDRNGQEMALSLPARAVYARPELVSDPGKEARKVAEALGLDPAGVHAAFKKSDPFVYVARGVDPAKAATLERQGLPGIGFLPESKRYYPGGALAPQVLGFVGVDGTGLAGLEQQYQSLLAGRPGHEVVEADPRGVLIPQGENVDVPPVQGDDLILTVDRQIQFRAQASLEAAVKANHAKGGTIVVLNPTTGEILAMADSPWFDPNAFTEASGSSIRNRGVTDAYEPGSVNKIVTAAAALQEGYLKLDQRLMVPDHLQLYTKVFRDAHLHPPQRMTLGDILAYSSNVGTIKVAERLGPNLLYDYLQRFGLTRTTGLGFPGESAGLLPPPRHWSGTSMGTIPIGQGIAVTPLQMATVYATIANGGVWVRPRLLRGTVGPDGTFRPAQGSVTRRVVSTETAKALTRMLAYAVDVGTGTQAQIPGYWVAGKTGTARKVRPDGTGYEVGKYIASFIGFVPAGHPALVVAAVLDEPSTVYGGVAAAPLFRDVARFALARLRVAPARKLPLPPHAIRTVG